ncbi:MlaD family protein [Candidatus Cloacimonadota bacterium]
MKFHENKKRTEVKVGVFTIISIVILVAAYAWFTEVVGSHKFTSIQVNFTNAGNVEIGSDVCINGVKKGRVKSIQVQQSGVLIELRVIVDFPLHEGTEFQIMEANLMGDVRVEITPGTGDTQLNLQEIQSGERKFGLAGLIAELGGIIYDLESILDIVAGQDNFVESLQMIVDTTQVVMNKVSASYNRNADYIEKLIVNSTELTQKINRIVDNNEQGIYNTIEKSDLVMNRIIETLLEMKTITDNFKEISGKMAGNDSSFNRLVSEKELYDNVLKATASMDSLLQDIKKNPKKYFEIKVF